MAKLTPFEDYVNKYCKDCQDALCHGKSGNVDQIYKCAQLRSTGYGKGKEETHNT